MAQLTLLLTGDVMLGRGIDQVQAHPGDPTLYEEWARSASHYVELAEARNGRIPAPVDPEYVWGDALPLFHHPGVSARVINLETAVTDRGRPWPDKGIHYRMDPANVSTITTAGINCCVLANNHVLDWSHDGLEQTLRSLEEAGPAVAGAGRDTIEARRAPAINLPGGGRVVVVARGVWSSGIPSTWEAGPGRGGVAVTDLSPAGVDEIASSIEEVAGPGDLVVASIHWGPNWGYHLPPTHQGMARGLIDRAGVHVVHGHSSHHPLGIEVYRGRLILYGCGDLVNDYEGISGHEDYHPDLGLVYLVTLDTKDGRMVRLELVPFRRRRFRLEKAADDEVSWLAAVLSREGPGALVVSGADGRLRLR